MRAILRDSQGAGLAVRTAGILLLAGWLSGAAACALAAESSGSLAAERLRCEYLVDPLGIDAPRPELSWIVTSPARGAVQSAYRVLVASTPEKLAADEGDLWDSGKAASGATFGVAYAGAALKSHQACHWKVMAWDGDDDSGPWSEPALWTVGLLDQQEWVGAWIGYDAPRAANGKPPVAELAGAQWIGHAADDPEQAPAARRIYRRIWELPADVRIARAELTIAADDTGDVHVNGRQVALTRSLKQPLVVDVRPYLRAGQNDIRVACHNQGGPAGICARLVVATADMQELVLTTDDTWTSAAPGGSPWHALPLDDAKPVRVLAPFGSQPWGELVVRSDVTAPPAYLRGTFEIAKPVKRATVYLAALGWADLSLNGRPVNADYFSSGWTDYRKRVYYRAYEVGELVRQGENAWGALLADGWYSGRIGWDSDRDHYGRAPRVRAMLRVEYDDGSSATFATDESWTAMEGPTRVADILVGEEYDATAEAPGWNEPGFAAERSAPVDVGAEVSPAIERHPGPPVVVVGEFAAQSVTEPAPGVYVFDLGQNFAGVARLKVRGRRGQQVQLRFAERLNDDGTLYTTNLRYARCVDRYTCRGEGEETWQPRQTFHGFQYVELTGVDEPPAADAVTGIALSSDTPWASEFECSDPKLNRLYENVKWTQRANFIDVPTDCPQRDERLGWTGDAQVYARTACLNADVQAFFRKWLVDLADSQRADGQLPMVAPLIVAGDDGGPAWADAGVICPWEMYLAYEDRTLLERQYPSMARFVEFCRNRSKEGVLPPDNFHCFGDWLSINADTPKEVIYAAYYARSVDLLRRAARVLGKHDDAKRYGELFERIKGAFNKEYVAEDGLIRGDTQCCYVLAIVGKLVDGPMREQAARRLVANIEARGNRLSTGFVGTKDLMLALSEIGRTDVALRLLHQEEFPGWKFSINHGATSIWERWDGWTPESGFQSAGMNSFAHYSFGAVYGWMAENLGGFQTVLPGQRRMRIAPVFDPALDHCRVRYDGIRGAVETEWRRSGGGIELRCVVPANTTAYLTLADLSPERDVVVDGKPLAESGLEQIPVPTLGTLSVELPAGEHRFQIRNGK